MVPHDLNTTIKPDTLSTESMVGHKLAMGWVEICKIVMSLLGIIGNSLVGLTFIKIKHMRSNTNYFIVSLAVADFITSWLVLPYPVMSPVTNGAAGEVYCRLVYSDAFLWISFKASVFNLVAITVERYFAIVHPVTHKRAFTPRVCLVMVAIAWLSACAVESISFYIFLNDSGSQSCLLVWPSKIYRKVIAVLLYLASFLIPVVVLIIVYIRMLSSIKAHAKILQSHRDSDYRNAISLLRTREKIIKMLFLVVITFMICWAPNQTLFLCLNFDAPLEQYAPYYQFFILLAFCNSCMNPIIYSFKNKQFRDALRLLFFKRCGATVNPNSSANIQTTAGRTQVQTGTQTTSLALTPMQVSVSRVDIEESNYA